MSFPLAHGHMWTVVATLLTTVTTATVPTDLEVLSPPPPLPPGGQCGPEQLAVYRLELATHWSRDLFPKQYPEKRPPAQWSKVLGRSHDAGFSLFREGEPASKALQLFAEKGETDGLDPPQPVLGADADDDADEIANSSSSSVLDTFTGHAIPQGVGHSNAQFFVDSNHSMVSAVVRIVPSPDWFAGVDSLQLCRDGRWLDRALVHADPLDAGTDNGFTFTAPNWPSDPPSGVERIQSRRPNHPANSFYYPHLDRLPAIATFTFLKERVYRLMPESDEAAKENLHPDGSNAIEPPETREETSNTTAAERPRRSKKNRRSSRSCRVGEWSTWSECSASCGVGDALRRRNIVYPAKQGGKPCPPLQEHRWCGGQSNCAKNFFNW